MIINICVLNKVDLDIDMPGRGGGILFISKFKRESSRRFIFNAIYRRDIKVFSTASDNLMNESQMNSYFVSVGKFKIDIKNLSKYLLNRRYITNEDLKKFDLYLFNLFIYLNTTNKFISKNMKITIIKNIYEILEELDFNKDIKDIKDILINLFELAMKENNNLFKNYIFNENENENENENNWLEMNSIVDEFIQNINDYADLRNISIEDKLNNLRNLIQNVLLINNKVLNSYLRDSLKDIENNCFLIATKKLEKSVGSKKKLNHKVIEWTGKDYEKEFNLKLSNGINEINKKLIKWLYNEKDIIINNVDDIAKNIMNTIVVIKKDLAGLLLYNSKYLFDDNSMNKINVKSKVKIFNKLTENNLIYNTNFSIKLIQNLVIKIENMETLNNSLNKLASLNAPLPLMISKILNSNLSNFEKQIAIEKAVTEYELNFFNLNMDSIDARNRILHKIFPKLSKQYQGLILEYSLNNYLKLKKSVAGIKSHIEEIKSAKVNESGKKSNPGKDISANIEKEFYKTIVIVIIMYLGIDKCISYSFAQILKLLNTSQGDNKRTNIVIYLGEKVIKLIKYRKDDFTMKNLSKILPKDDLLMIIDSLNDIGYFWIGDTLLRIITDNCDIIQEELKKDSEKDSYLILKINDNFIKELIVDTISLVDLPMLTEPRKLNGQGIYFPYINTDTTNLHLFEGELIRSKYNQKYKTEGSIMLYNSVDYLNSMKFKINKKMLKFILTEWENKESKLFKGLNFYQPILETDSKDIKAKKESSNSTYILYSNIITMASLFKNQEFYLPVFVDFRGRIYPLSNYISYQAGDLGRSLLLFADNYAEILNSYGIECLNIYLANLAGYDKLPWKLRLNKVDQIVKNYVESSKISNIKYVEDNLDKINEPFQFISIMQAKLLLINNPNTPISNPILFYASCSGIQHIASLTLEQELAKNVNVYTESRYPSYEYPKDFYIYALGKIRDKLFVSEIETLKDIKLNRKIIKRSVMTIPYNISMTGIGDHLLEHFEVIWVLKERFIKIPGIATYSGNDILLNTSEFGNLTKLIYFVLTKELPSLKILSEYFNSMIDIFVKLNLPITWITPAGLRIRYTNIKFTTTKIKANLLSTGKLTTIKLPTNQLDKLNMKRSFMPNLIHSLDASNVHLLLNNISKFNLPIYTIHDCFASTPNSMFKLEKLVKEAFIEIYFKDEGYLLKLHKHLIKSIVSATDPIQINYQNDKENIVVPLNTKSENFDFNQITKNSANTQITVMDTENNEIINIPDMPSGYKDKNKLLNSFIKGLLNSKYFIG